MEEKDLNLYDKVVNECVYSLFVIGRSNDNTIVLSNFDRKNEECLCIYEIANMVRIIFNMKVSAVLNFWDYLLFSIKFKCRKNIKREKFTKDGDLDCKVFIESVNKEHTDGILKEIYKEYYKRGK